MSNYTMLTEADNVLDYCARPRPPLAGTSAVYKRKGWLLQFLFPADTTSPKQTIVKEITGDTDWCLRSVLVSALSYGLTPVSIQILLPDGTFLINSLQPTIVFGGSGSYRYTFKDEMACPPGSKLQVTLLQGAGVSVQTGLAVLFEGAYRYLLEGGEGRILPANEALENIPQYFADPCQNIMAPAWQVGVVDPPPMGYYDEDFIYSGLQSPTVAFPAGFPGSSIDVAGNNLTATQSIGMDGAEFHLSRILVGITEDETVTAGSVLARIRLSSGQTLFDDYVDIARYVCSTYWPIDVLIPPNEIVYADLQAVDVAGTGLIYWTMFLDGFKRRKR